MNAQVGINTTNPTATLHIVGTTIPSVAGGTTTLITNDFTTGSITSIAGTGNTCTVAPNIWNVSATSTSASCTTCTGNRAYIQYSASCNQNQMFKTAVFTPTTTAITIGFNYSYNDFTGNDDSFIVTLYNETTASVVATLVNLAGTDMLDATYTPTVATVVSGNNYSLRFTYTGIDDLGAAVDNILITQTTAAVPGTYTFRLQDGTQSDGRVMTSDANGNGYWKTPTIGGADAQTLSIVGNDISISNGNTITIPSGGSNTYTNGLTLTGSTVRLGGTLTQNTSINLDTYDLTFSSNNTATTPGEITFQGKDRIVMNTGFADNYINFGGYASLDIDDGTTFTDTGNTSFTKDFVAGFYGGLTGGNAISTGSIEYIVDGTAELFTKYSFSPLTDNSGTCGTSNHRWNSVYSTNGTINTSDANLKKEIKPLNYGITELMKLKPVTYKWKNNKIGDTTIPENLQENKIGFLAQDLLKVVPEVVKTHDWRVTDEKKPNTFHYVKNENLGVMYSDIVPITVKAIQEQQSQIEALKKEIEELKALVKKQIK